jgi:hypothetical protein
MGVLEISSILGKEGRRSLSVFFKLASWAMLHVLATSKQVVVKALIKRML